MNITVKSSGWSTGRKKDETVERQVAQILLKGGDVQKIIVLVIAQYKENDATVLLPFKDCRKFN